MNLSESNNKEVPGIIYSLPATIQYFRVIAAEHMSVRIFSFIRVLLLITLLQDLGGLELCIRDDTFTRYLLAGPAG